MLAGRLNKATMKDYLILHRQILHWEWHDDAYMVSLFIHLLCMANYLPNYRYRGKAQRVGELHTSVPKLSLLTGMSQNTIISKLRKLQSTGEITFTCGKKGTDIYIVNYAKYQFVMPSSSATGAERHEEQSGEQRAEHNAEQSDELLAVPSGAQVEEQGAKQPKSIQKKASSASCSAHGSATVAPQGGDNQQIYNIHNNIIKEKNIKKKGSEPVQGTAGQPTTAELEAMFNQFRQAYKGTKRGLKVELENFKKKYSNWREIVPCLMPALEREIAWREQMQAAGQFVPQWAYLQTWINQARWENEFEAVQPAKGGVAQYAQQAQTQQPPSDDEYGGSFGGVDC